MRKGFYYQWSSNAVGKMKIIRNYLIENVINKRKELQKLEYDDLQLNETTSNSHYFEKMDFKEETATTTTTRKSTKIFNDEDIGS